jgi:F0F1-type ATP synthase assembly protein I
MPEDNSPKKRFDPSSYLRYSGMALEFFIICAIGAFAGIKTDKWLQLDFPAFTIIFLLLAMTGAMMRIFKQFSK